MFDKLKENMARKKAEKQAKAYKKRLEKHVKEKQELANMEKQIPKPIDPSKAQSPFEPEGQPLKADKPAERDMTVNQADLEMKRQLEMQRKMFEQQEVMMKEQTKAGETPQAQAPSAPSAQPTPQPAPQAAPQPAPAPQPVPQPQAAPQPAPQPQPVPQPQPAQVARVILVMSHGKKYPLTVAVESIREVLADLAAKVEEGKVIDLSNEQEILLINCKHIAEITLG